MEGEKVGNKQRRRRRRVKQNILLRNYQYRAVKLFKTMKILIKKLKARNAGSSEKSVKKLMKLRKCMDSLLINKMTPNV